MAPSPSSAEPPIGPTLSRQPSAAPSNAPSKQPSKAPRYVRDLNYGRSCTPLLSHGSCACSDVPSKSPSDQPSGVPSKEPRYVFRFLGRFPLPPSHIVLALSVMLLQQCPPNNQVMFLASNPGVCFNLYYCLE